MQVTDTRHQMILEQMAQLYHTLNMADDEHTRHKILSLYEKVTKERLSISFCGHFSAGKSSLLNHMIDDKILPASPIPTSGNLIKLRAGSERAVLHLTSGERVIVPAPYSLEDFQAFSKSTSLVEEIEVYLGSRIHKNVELIDTPGVDSTDETHQRLTEDALHLADMVMYVTDYNHVQSTVNFHFMQHLQELNKPFSLVINQVDKHQNAELSFQAFKDRVEASLHEWGLFPEKIYYTTLMDGHEEHNDLALWLNDMGGWLNGRFDQLTANTDKALSAVISDHLQRMEQDFQLILDDEGLSAVPSETALEQLKKDYHDHQTALTQLIEKDQSFISIMSEQASKAISSSILMPYETRELGRHYLESLSADFKMGLFSSQKKIDKERAARLSSFHEAFQKNSQTMEWNTRDQLLKTAISQFGFQESELSSIYALAIESTETHLQQNTQQGAQATGQYVLTFTENISDAFKSKMRRKAMDWIEDLSGQYALKTETEKQMLHAKINKHHLQINQWKAAIAKRNKLNSYEEHLKDLLSAKSTPNQLEESLLPELEQAYKLHEDSVPLLTLKEALQQLRQSETKSMKDDLSNGASDGVVDMPSPSTHAMDEDANKALWVNTLEKASTILSPLSEFKDQAIQLKKRAARIDKNEMTIALFGAFSAGKTSFANALLGEKVLPVSPNPTTAVISQIKASTETFGHKQVEVKLKSMKQLLSDVQESLTLFNEEIDQIEDLVPLLTKIKTKEQTAELKLHYAFLQAVTAGMSDLLPSIGTALIMDLEAAHDMIANEVKSCFIEYATIYYDAPLTEQGIVLVDTPGADSINARHTDVAFNYIKNADAILFVTYYNHAFSKADREFLIQLGRVKDTFSMDKMFFIVNAADLAESQTEEQQVTSYISSQLLTFGIRQPRVFGISSKLALMRSPMEQGRLSVEDQQALDTFSNRREISGPLSSDTLYQVSGLKSFEASLKAYIVNDLLNQTAQTGFKEMDRSSAILQEMVRNMMLNDEDRQKKSAHYTQMLSEIRETLDKKKDKTPETAIAQATDEWFYYVKKRIMQRYLDEFTAYVNPSQFQSNETGQHEHLLNQLYQLIAFLSYDIDQEMRATYLRIESYIKNAIKQQGDRLQGLINPFLPDWTIPIMEDITFETAGIPSHLDKGQLEGLNSVTKFYKNNRQFFEKDGLKKVRDALEKMLDEPITAVLEHNNKEAKAYYLGLYNQAEREQQDQIEEDCMDQITVYQKQLIMSQDEKPLYETTLSKLQTLIKTIPE